MNRRDLDQLGDLASGEFASVAERWIRPFCGSFPDFKMRIVDLVAEDDTVVAHFKCSGTHPQDVDEVCIFRVKDGKLVAATGIEDNLSRMGQLGIQFIGPVDRLTDPRASKSPKETSPTGTQPYVSVLIPRSSSQAS